MHRVNGANDAVDTIVRLVDIFGLWCKFGLMLNQQNIRCACGVNAPMLFG